ncbi:glycosyl hydrolase 53 family protein [Mucilaginibacter sp. PAMB04274]|uniref:glycoside hydrolase family 53 protein n=1 Tax=Mucilaginibacter sp. PAMB04274 TaxID=3138568 RepID=UPI0031F6D511
MSRIIITCLLCLAYILPGCKKGSPANTETVEPPVSGGSLTAIVKGADVSWLTQMEAAGYKFYNAAGAEQECMQLLKSKGINAIRLRAWVNPTDGWCNTADVLAKALRAQTLGLKIMIDFHYSDSWADPGKQTKPAAWKDLSFTALTDAVYTYTASVLNTLKASGITPDWVQVGNETADGMLWEDGRASTHMANFAKLITSGYNAVKSVNPTTLVIVHIDRGYDNALFRWMFDGLKANGGKWDIIGLSLYPTVSNWQTLNGQCLNNMNDMVARYGTPVMVVEVGMPASEAAASKAFITDLIAKVRSVPNNQGLGVFYWEPQSYNWQGYGLGAFDNSGKPTIALDAFTD